MRYHAHRLCVLCGVLLSVRAYGVEKTGAEMAGAEQTQASARRPTLAMLEYLGSMVDSEDGLIGPEDLAGQGETQKQEPTSKTVAAKTGEVRDDED